MNKPFCFKKILLEEKKHIKFVPGILLQDKGRLSNVSSLCVFNKKKKTCFLSGPWVPRGTVVKCSSRTGSSGVFFPCECPLARHFRAQPSTGETQERHECELSP